MWALQGVANAGAVPPPSHPPLRLHTTTPLSPRPSLTTQHLKKRPQNTKNKQRITNRPPGLFRKKSVATLSRRRQIDNDAQRQPSLTSLSMTSLRRPHGFCSNHGDESIHSNQSTNEISALIFCFLLLLSVNSLVGYFD